MIEFKEKTVVVLGAARQGLALAKYAAAHGAHVIITDKRPYDQLEAARESVADIDPEWVCGDHPLSLLDRADMLCVTAADDCGWTPEKIGSGDEKTCHTIALLPCRYYCTFFHALQVPFLTKRLA